MATITVTISREVEDQEIEDMITGTGALGYSWWVSAEHVDDGWAIVHWDRDDGETTPKRTVLTAERICEAFGEVIQIEYVDPAHDDTKEAIGDSLGNLDAQAADVVLQWAVFGDLVYG